MATAPRKSNARDDRRDDKPVRKTDKDLPLIEDIRLLGRILGDVIREQEGVAAFELIEQVRQLSVTFRRDAATGIQESRPSRRLPWRRSPWRTAAVSRPAGRG